MGIPISNIQFAQGIFQARLGQAYGYGGQWERTNLQADTDCSGLVGEELEAVTKGNGMSWGHPVSTESWPYDYNTGTAAPPGTVGPYGTIAVSSPKHFPADAAVTIAIHHGGGGESSHMNCAVDGMLMEDNGDVGVCTRGTGAVEQTDPYWTDWWYLPGPIGGGSINNPSVHGGIVVADAVSIANDMAGQDGQGNLDPWRVVHLLRDAQIGDLPNQTDGDAEAPNVSASVYDQVVTLSKILTRRYKGHDIWDAVMLIGDHLGVL